VGSGLDAAPRLLEPQDEEDLLAKLRKLKRAAPEAVRCWTVAVRAIFSWGALFRVFSGRYRASLHFTEKAHRGEIGRGEVFIRHGKFT
jgi:hypothetical protein